MHPAVVASGAEAWAPEQRQDAVTRWLDDLASAITRKEQASARAFPPDRARVIDLADDFRWACARLREFAVNPPEVPDSTHAQRRRPPAGSRVMSVPLSIVVADPGTTQGVLAVLRDWSAVGLISPFMWVTADGPSSGTLRQEAALVLGGSVTWTTVGRHLADVGDSSVIRVCALDWLSGIRTLQCANGIVAQLHDASPVTKLVRIHAIPLVEGMAVDRAPAPEPGWHVVILSPEDSHSPTSARAVVSTDDPPIALSMLTAARLAGLLGLWRGLSEGPLDSQPPPPGTQVMLARTFFRRRDANQAAHDIRCALTDTSRGLPVPHRDGAPMQSVEDERAAAVRVADQLLETHPTVLEENRRLPASAEKVTKIGRARGLQMLLSFVWAAMRNAPRDWLNSVTAQAATAVAGASQWLAFGEDSSYQIVVNGRLPSGALATWEEVDGALDSIGRGKGAGRYSEQSDDLSPLWKDYLDVALMLADGQKRSEGVDQPEIGPRPAVLRSAARIALPPTDSFRNMPPHVSATLGVAEIPPSDVALAQHVLKELDSHAQRSVIALDLGRAREALAEWQRDVQLPSYSGRVGERLAARIGELRSEIASLSSSLHRLASPAVDSAGLAERQMALARRMRITIGVTSATLIGLGIAGYLEWLDPSTAAIIGAVALAICVAILTLSFFLGQRELFHLLNRRSRDEAQGKVLTQNLASAVADLKRVTRAYRQHLAWGAIVGAFLQRPFGPSPNAPEDLPLLQGDLPRCVQTGVVPHSDGFAAMAAEELAPNVYSAGWLSRPWATLMSQIDSYCPTNGAAVRGHPERIFADSVASPPEPPTGTCRRPGKHGSRKLSRG